MLATQATQTTQSPGKTKPTAKAKVSGAIDRALNRPGGTMQFELFCDKWLPRLYKGIEKFKHCPQLVTCSRSGETLKLTWKQAWQKELESWGFPPDSTRHLTFEGRKAPHSIKRLAYLMDTTFELIELIEHSIETL